ncbi:MAG: TonB-dependent receptor [Prevotellaceae bacterium]|jgi:TonB-linked SusC/RagA family outer membrane protein|nr:TonB-dependent receptor [Prevotellaceae bacterium]
MTNLFHFVGTDKYFPTFFLLFALLSGANAAVAQPKMSITGRVLDERTKSVAVGATVKITGSAQGAIIGADGNFSFTVPSLPVSLEASLFGYKTLELDVYEAPAEPILIYLVEDFNALGEVVVVGYGTQKKSDLTGSLSRVSEAQIKERPVQNILQALQGRAAGVDVTSNLRPGGVGDIRIRGTRSITASNAPLYVVDGIPLSADEAAAINPNDIATTEILKDASATAIYGSRGANGVILIGLKEGAKGKVSVDYDASFSFSKIHSTTDWMNSGELLDWQRQSHINGGTYTGQYGTAPDPVFDVPKFGGGEQYGENNVKSAYAWSADGSVQLRPATPDEIAGGYAAEVPVYQPGKMFDQRWTDLVSRTGLTQNHQISLATGSELSRLYLSLGYLSQEGALIDQDYTRYSVNLKGDITPKKWLTIGLSLNAIKSLQNYGVAENTANNGGKDSYSQALSLLPYASAYDENGDILNANHVGLSEHNVLLNINNAINEHAQASTLANTFAEVRFAPWLKYTVKFGAQYTNREYGSFYGPEYTNPFTAIGTAPNTGYNQHAKHFAWTLENLLQFDKQLDIHSIGATLLQEAQENTSNGINVRGYNVTFPSSLWHSLQENANSSVQGGTSYSRSSLLSYMGRLNYSLLDRYLLTATGRWDGASVLAPGHKWEFFPSLAVAWKLENESFLQNVRWLDQLKLRYGWGIVGNAAVSPYTTSGAIGTAVYVFNETITPGYKSSVMPNAELGWEKTLQHNFGIDFSLLQRISGSVEVYRAYTSDLLLSRSILPVAGYESILANIGKTKNRGVEVTLSTVNIKSKTFTWKTDLQWSYNKEEIVELADGKIDDANRGWYIGYPISVFRDYKYERLWQDNEEDARLIELYKKIGTITAIPGQVKVKDQELVVVPEGTAGSKSVTLASGETVTYLDNGFGKIDDNDKEILGSIRPDWIAGLTNTLSYKNFELSFFLHARVGGLYYGALQTLGRRVENDTWSPENTGAKFPQPTTASFSNYNTARSYTDGTLISLRHVSLGYTVPKKFLNRYKIANLQIYGQVQNPYIWGGEAVRAGLNPDDAIGWETRAGAESGGQTANTILVRNFVLGVRIGL